MAVCLSSSDEASEQQGLLDGPGSSESVDGPGSSEGLDGPGSLVGSKGLSVVVAGMNFLVGRCFYQRDKFQWL